MDGKTPKIPLTFRIFKGDQLLRSETLSQPVIKIGKLSSSHLRIEDELVSRMHAVIEVTGTGDISIIDLGSTKGTIVNGQKINKATLQNGDVIVLGETRLELTVGDVDEEPTKVARQAAAVPSPSAPVGRTTGPEEVISSTPRPSPTARPAPAPAPSPAATAPIAARTAAAPAQAAAPLGGARPAPAMQQPVAPAPQVQMAAPSFGADAGADMGGKRSIEIAAMMQDSVVAVRHLSDPQGGKISTNTMVLALSGALLLLVTIGVFFRGVIAAKHNRDDYHARVEIGVPNDKGVLERTSIIDWREPDHLNPALDAVVIVGLIGGLVFVTWALARFLDERRSPFFRIGTEPNVEFPTDATTAQGVSSFTLVGPSGGGHGSDFVFSWMDGMKGEMTVDGKATPLAELPRSMPIPHKARIRAEVGANTFFISSVPAPRAPGAAFTVETSVAVFAGVSAGFHAIIVLLLYLVAPQGSGYSNDNLDDDGRKTLVQIKPPEDPKTQEQLNDSDKQDKSGGTGTAMALDSGKMGKKDSTREAGQYQMKKNSDTQQLSKEQKDERARNAGALGVIKASQGSLFASITANGDFSSGLDDHDIQGGLIGNEPGEMNGGFGYGVSGTGPGGGGTGLGTIGTGRYGTIGHGSGTGTGYGIGSGGGGLRGHNAGAPKISIGDAKATGDLDKNTIRRYVRQKLSQIEYCYTKQLQAKPTLEGTVNMQFTIDGNGRVIAANPVGGIDGDVDGCVADVIRSIQFPKPTGGGIVNVTSYPFNFHPTGGADQQ